jgi:hypothetical protein
MAQVDFTTPPAFRSGPPKARMNIYFAMLIIAFAAMFVACIVMFLEVKNFGGFGAVPGRVSSVERPSRTIAAVAASMSEGQPRTNPI